MSRSLGSVGRRIVHRRGTAHHRRPAAILGAAALVVAVTAGAAPAFANDTATTAATTASAQSLPTSTTFFTFPTSDGTVLTANVVQPTTVGPHPVLVFPSSWSLNDLEYLAQANTLAQHGYIVVSYTPRGFWTSGGTIGVAGPSDVGDVSTAITWALKNTQADPTRIGVGGVSYGAGLALLAAGHDPRIKAVAAMSGWTDLVYSLYGGQTRHKASVDLLYNIGQATGKISPEFLSLYNNFTTFTNVPAVIAFGQVRSASTYLDAINRNGTAIFMSNGFEDSFFSPNQLIDFYNRLTVPKRLELAPGDHATVEASGLAGLPNEVWTNVGRWFDQYLNGVNTGIAAQNPIQLTTNTGTAESYPSWSAVSTRTDRLGFGPASFGDGSLGTSVRTGWTTRIASGSDTTADGGTVLVSGAVTALGVPPIVWLPTVDRNKGAVWQGPMLGAAEKIRGIGNVHLTLTPSAASGTVIAYLYDVDVTGTARLITQAPYTYLGATPGTALPADIPLNGISYDVPAGHHIGVVIDTVDPLYYDMDKAGSTVAFSSPANDPSTLTLPVR